MKTLTVYHFQGHDSLSLAVFNGIVLWGAADQTGTGYCVPLAFRAFAPFYTLNTPVSIHSFFRTDQKSSASPWRMYS